MFFGLPQDVEPEPVQTRDHEPQDGGLEPVGDPPFVAEVEADVIARSFRWVFCEPFKPGGSSEPFLEDWVVPEQRRMSQQCDRLDRLAGFFHLAAIARQCSQQVQVIEIAKLLLDDILGEVGRVRQGPSSLSDEVEFSPFAGISLAG